MAATKLNFVYFRLLHSNGQECAKKFISRLKWTARALKTGFSSLSYSDKTTNDKFDGHTLK